jgi:hypothetical protein
VWKNLKACDEGSVHIPAVGLVDPLKTRHHCLSGLSFIPFAAFLLAKHAIGQVSR